MGLAEDIRAWRKAVGWTQERLAAALHMDMRAVRRWEAGTATPHPATLRDLQNLMEANPAPVASASPEPPPSGPPPLPTGPAVAETVKRIKAETGQNTVNLRVVKDPEGYTVFATLQDGSRYRERVTATGHELELDAAETPNGPAKIPTEEGLTGTSTNDSIAPVNAVAPVNPKAPLPGGRRLANIQLTNPLIAGLDAVIVAEGGNRSDHVRKAVEEYLERKRKKD